MIGQKVSKDKRMMQLELGRELTHDNPTQKYYFIITITYQKGRRGRELLGAPK